MALLPERRLVQERRSADSAATQPPPLPPAFRATNSEQTVNTQARREVRLAAALAAAMSRKSRPAPPLPKAGGGDGGADIAADPRSLRQPHFASSIDPIPAAGQDSPDPSDDEDGPPASDADEDPTPAPERSIAWLRKARRDRFRSGLVNLSAWLVTIAIAAFIIAIAAIGLIGWDRSLAAVERFNARVRQSLTVVPPEASVPAMAPLSLPAKPAR